MPLSSAGPDLVAEKHSSRSGSRTTPTNGPSASSHATLIPNTGTPNRKLIVPSSGSITQRSSPSPLAPPSSPRIASPGRRRASRSRIAASAARSASDTRSVGVLFDRTRCPRPNRGSSSAAEARAASRATTSSSSSCDDWLTAPGCTGSAPTLRSSSAHGNGRDSRFVGQLRAAGRRNQRRAPRRAVARAGAPEHSARCGDRDLLVPAQLGARARVARRARARRQPACRSLRPASGSR